MWWVIVRYRDNVYLEREDNVRQGSEEIYRYQAPSWPAAEREFHRLGQFATILAKNLPKQSGPRLPQGR